MFETKTHGEVPHNADVGGILPSDGYYGRAREPGPQAIGRRMWGYPTRLHRLQALSTHPHGKEATSAEEAHGETAKNCAQQADQDGHN